MSNPNDDGVCDNHFSLKKLFCNQFGVCRYWYAPTYCQSKTNHKHFGIHIQSEIENKKKLTEQKYTVEEIEWTW